jgi:hypothetical protein
LLPRPAIHSDLAALAAVPAADQHGTSIGVEVAFGQRESLADPQSGSPEHDDEAAQSDAVGVIPGGVGVIPGGAHHGDDLLDRRRVCRILQTLVARRPSVVIAGQRRG